MSDRRNAPAHFPKPEEGQSREEWQRRRLEKINEYLAARGLRPLAHTGTWQRGEFEILDVVGCSANPWYTIVEFSCIKPDGQPGVYFMKFENNGLHGLSCVVLVMIGEALVFVRQQRPTMLVRGTRHWPTEVSRQFANSGISPTIVDRKLREAAKDEESGRLLGSRSLPLGVIGSELAPLILSGSLSVEEVVRLGVIAEDTGMSTVIPEYWLIRLAVADGTALGESLGTKAMGIRTYPIDEVIRRRTELDLNDGHSMSALMLLYEHLGRIR